MTSLGLGCCRSHIHSERVNNGIGSENAALAEGMSFIALKSTALLTTLLLHHSDLACSVLTAILQASGYKPEQYQALRLGVALTLGERCPALDTCVRLMALKGHSLWSPSPQDFVGSLLHLELG